jgi:hypothetical protein
VGGSPAPHPSHIHRPLTAHPDRSRIDGGSSSLGSRWYILLKANQMVSGPKSGSLPFEGRYV